MAIDDPRPQDRDFGTVTSATERQLRALLALAALSFAPALAFYYVGEEAIFPISSLEMWHQREWITQLLFGSSLLHNPLYNWLIIPCAAVVGWEYVLPVARAITIGATLATAAVTGWLLWRLLADRALAWFGALVYLTLADVLLYRGWLAYVDPLFALFVFAAIAALWVACEENRGGLLALAVLSLTCAFMSKAFTAYVFYGAAGFVLFWRPSCRRFLLSPPSLTLHAAAVAAPLLWLALVPRNTGQGTRMFKEIVDKLLPESVAAYAAQLAGFPLETLLRLSPACLLAMYLLWIRRTAVPAPYRLPLGVAAAMAGFNFLPYWLAPHGNIRYLMPLYPLFAVVFALVMWSAWQRHATLIVRWLTAAIALKFLAAVVLFPYYQSHYRGENYAAAARDIMARTALYPLYTTDVSASGLSVAGYIDAWRHPAPPLVWPPPKWETGFVISYTLNPELGELAQRYALGGNDLFLLCRGAACNDFAR